MKSLLQLIYTFSLLAVFSTVSAQQRFLFQAAQKFADPGYLVINGKIVKMHIDRQSPLDTLIARLGRDKDIHMNNYEVDSAGYTALGYSVALHNEDAIKPLLNLAASTTDLAVRFNVIMVLNLIGIHCKITGHNTEEFTDKPARDALLSLLKYPDIRQTVLCKLLKDPWQSDVAALFSFMQRDTSDSWGTQNALVRYCIDGFPTHQPIPAWADTVKMSAPFKNSDESSDIISVYHVMIANMFVLNHSNLDMEKHIRRTNWAIYNTPVDWKPQKGLLTITLADFLSTAMYLDYSTPGNPMQYYVRGQKIYICSPATTKAMLLDWWASQPESFKQSFNVDAAKKPSPFLKEYIFKD